MIDSESPIIDKFFEEDGAAEMLQKKNFSPAEFSAVLSAISKHFLQSCNIGCGQKSTLQPKDVLFMIITVL